MPTEQEPIKSRAAIAGHPLHPMMIHFPVAALLLLVGTDIGYALTGDPFWARAGLWLAGVGAFGGWGASIAGAIDIVLVERVRHMVTSWCHAIIAVMLLSLATLNWLMRLGDHELLLLPWGLWASVLTAVLISLAAYLGGKLVYEHTVAVNTGESS